MMSVAVRLGTSSTSDFATPSGAFSGKDNYKFRIEPRIDRNTTVAHLLIGASFCSPLRARDGREAQCGTQCC